MARQKSEDRRATIVRSAIRLIARDGLGASTASIAKEAGVPNGSVFTYFPTKIDLFNQLHIEISRALIDTIENGLTEAGDEREQMVHIWTRWTDWGANNADKRRALALLALCDEVIPETRRLGLLAAHRLVNLIHDVARHGVLRDHDPALAVTVVESLANATIDAMNRDPEHSMQIREAAFAAVWKALS